jgi:hypothetical protein
MFDSSVAVWSWYSAEHDMQFGLQNNQLLMRSGDHVQTRAFLSVEVYESFFSSLPQVLVPTSPADMEELANLFPHFRFTDMDTDDAGHIVYEMTEYEGIEEQEGPNLPRVIEIVMADDEEEEEDNMPDASP